MNTNQNHASISKRQLIGLSQSLRAISVGTKLRNDIGWKYSIGEVSRRVFGNKYETKSEYWEKYTGRLNKNLKGSPIVQDDFIYQIEHISPDIVWFYENPIWEAITLANATMKEVHQVMHKLPAKLTSRLFKVNSKTKVECRVEIKTRNQIKRIAKMNDLDALACMIMLHRELELLMKIEALCEVKWEIYYLLSRLSTFMPLSLLANQFYRLINNLFLSNPLPLPCGSNEFQKAILQINHKTPIKVDMFSLEGEINSGVTWHAYQRGLCGTSQSDQLEFLFWISTYFKRTEIETLLRNLPSKNFDNDSFDELPERLKELMTIIKGDSRKYLPPTKYKQYSFELTVNDYLNQTSH